jgi:AcrR family transcriptional regulator
MASRESCNRITVTDMRRPDADTSSVSRRLRPPRQARSRQSQERVLDAFAAMLGEQPFEQIRIADLARRAGVAVTSIYARFEDKRALVLALHERHVEETGRVTDELLDPEKWAVADLETIVRAVVARIVAHQSARAPLLRTALLVNDRDVELRVAHLMRHGSERLAALLRPRLAHVPSRARDRLVDFAFRAVVAVLQQRLVFPTTEPGRYRLSDAELSRRLGDLFLGVVGR